MGRAPYSLIETAKLNGLEPSRYLWHVFQELPKAQSLTEIQRLLPWAVDSAYANGLNCKGIDGVC